MFEWPPSQLEDALVSCSLADSEWLLEDWTRPDFETPREDCHWWIIVKKNGINYVRMV